MASLLCSFSLARLFLFLVQLQVLHARGNGSFSVPDMLHNSNYRSRIVFHGDARAAENKSMIQISSSGRVVYTDPVSFEEGHGFSSYFSFSVSPEGGGRLTFLVSPVSFKAKAFDDMASGGSQNKIPMFVAVDFNLLKHSNHVGIFVGRSISVRSRNFSFAERNTMGRIKLHSWIDYQATYKKLEVRLSESSRRKPVSPLISFPINLSQMWKNDSRLLSLGSYDRNASQPCFLYSWKLIRVKVPRWIHSVPFDPNDKKNPEITKKESFCFVKVGGAVLSGMAVGVVGTLAVFYVWNAFKKRQLGVSVVPEECTVNAEEWKKVNGK